MGVRFLAKEIVLLKREFIKKNMGALFSERNRTFKKRVYKKKYVPRTYPSKEIVLLKREFIKKNMGALFSERNRTFKKRVYKKKYVPRTYPSVPISQITRNGIYSNVVAGNQILLYGFSFNASGFNMNGTVNPWSGASVKIVVLLIPLLMSYQLFIW
jgi:ribosomal protein L34E